jgi:GT2 family glycosyltransferase
VNVCIVAVNYNSYEHLRRYARSVAAALNGVTGVRCRFIVVDNSTVDQGSEVISEISSQFDDFECVRTRNLGYLPGAAYAIETLGMDCCQYDYLAVTNVDLMVDRDLFRYLMLIRLNPGVGMLAPAIISSHRRTDLNPKMVSRPSRRKLERSIALFSRPMVFWLYAKLADVKARFRSAAPFRGGNIYAPHGSFLLFVKSFFEAGGDLRYPRFLFGEEVYVAEECAARRLTINYCPRLVIHDSDHGSTSLERVSFISGEHVKSLKYLVGRYFQEGV